MLHELINKYAEFLTDNDYHILSYVEKEPERVANMTIMELSQQCNMSKSSILRMTKKLGFSGYSEFKYYLKESSAKNDSSGNVFELSENDIKRTVQLFDNQDKQPIYSLIDEAETIYAYGTGWGQQNALQELSRYLLSMDKRVYLIPSLRELQVASKNMSSDDLVIIASLSGDLDEVTSDLKKISHQGVPTLSITSFKNNHLAELSTYQLYFQSTDFGFAYNVAHKSFIGLHAIIDLLVRGYLDYKM
ncbi:MAG: MurR/RpiR family transcriptional regulator [Alkalibacterium sp.]|nr:MAG: MurR/RpiR family transcriptional regulator [Alkalibacterium sp.]